MTSPWERFKQAARLEEPENPPVALIVDSPWLPGYEEINTLDYFLNTGAFYDINKKLIARFPDIVWIPGFWVEYGMAAEPSAFGARIHFHSDRPPSIEPVVTDITHWAEAPMPDVHEDGFMPFVLHRYRQTDEKLRAEGLNIKMVAARGPMVTAAWVMGVTDLMTGLVAHPKEVHKFLDTITTTIINWLHAQLDAIKEPEGIMLLDDIVGMVSVDHYHEFIEPHLRRIFDEFEGLIRIYHNDTPCVHLFPALAEANFDVFNFTHVVDIAQAKMMMGHRVALMGNVPPLHVGVRMPPAEVKKSALDCLDKAAPGGGMILSVGGGVSPGMPAENVDAIVEAAHTWVRPSAEQIEKIRQEAMTVKSDPGQSARRSRRPRRPNSSS